MRVGCVIQLLADVLAYALKLAAADTRGVFRLVADSRVWELRWQRCRLWLLIGAPRRASEMDWLLIGIQASYALRSKA
jgi:hypothetical protein